ncbi:hypothetical protein B0J11DRAFT_513733 [Dendryphion nanum]|uniref:Uncharacterized protein n=1 Tax=Dendryphion nanum TaxID=256645 RepID=A0A9P9IY84_9PLEO|nr:hypothetical protein B0J11DRAFT_513733 [Dendryphion nanum]
MQLKALILPFALTSAVLAAPAPETTCTKVEPLFDLLKSVPGALGEFDMLSSGESRLAKRGCYWGGCGKCQSACRNNALFSQMKILS